MNREINEKRFTFSSKIFLKSFSHKYHARAQIYTFASALAFQGKKTQNCPYHLQRHQITDIIHIRKSKKQYKLISAVSYFLMQ